MSNYKRRLSVDDVDQPNAKIIRTETADCLMHQEIVRSSDAQDIIDDFDIVVKLRSETKARRNDPKYTLAQRGLYYKILLERSNGRRITPADRQAAHEEVAIGAWLSRERKTEDQTTPKLAASVVGNSDKSEHLDNTVTSAEQAERRIEETRIGEDDIDMDNDTEVGENDEFDDDESQEDEFEDDENDDEEEDDTEDESRSENDSNYEFEWLEPIDVKVIVKTNKDERGMPQEVAYCEAKLIRRNQMRDDFLEQMESPSEETSRLAFALFDRYGRLRKEFKTHEFIRGTGIWGQELDQGDLLLIEQVMVDKEYRRQGLGRRMIESLLTVSRQKTISFFAFVRPDFLRLKDLSVEWDSFQDNEASRDQLVDRERDRGIMFYRSLGFRRVGSTVWFAKASDNDHPSHQLSSTEDFDPPKVSLTDTHPLLNQFQQIINSNPHLSGQAQRSDTQPHEEPSLLGVLQDWLQNKGSADTCWISKDKDGNTVLHLAAGIFNAACVEWLLNQDFGTQLLQMRNNRGETALELLQFKLEKLRTQKAEKGSNLILCVSDKFKGHDENAIRCLISLKGLGSPESIMKSQGQDTLWQMVRGCTCGKCLQGFLSPRMSYALVFEAEIGYDMMYDDLDQSSGPDWVEDNRSRLSYLPSRVMKNLETNKSMRQGFVNLWSHILTCLKRGKIPDEFNVLQVLNDHSEWPPCTKNFLGRGGTVQSAFLAICKNAITADEWAGEGRDVEEFYDDMEKLPACRNDHEFGYVSGMCGYRRITPRPNVDMGGNRLDEDLNKVDSLL